MNAATDPQHLSVSKSKGIGIDWNDGHHSQLDIQYLRDRCPCATCTGAHGSPPARAKPADPFQMYQAALRIDSVEPVGSYAIKIRWSDGHDTGIYTWEYLRSIG